jgi:hypothetical protein
MSAVFWGDAPVHTRQDPPSDACLTGCLHQHVQPEAAHNRATRFRYDPADDPDRSVSPVRHPYGLRVSIVAAVGFRRCSCSLQRVDPSQRQQAGAHRQGLLCPVHECARREALTDKGRPLGAFLIQSLGKEALRSLAPKRRSLERPPLCASHTTTRFEARPGAALLSAALQHHGLPRQCVCRSRARPGRLHRLGTDRPLVSWVCCVPSLRAEAKLTGPANGGSGVQLPRIRSEIWLPSAIFGW